MGTLTNTSTSDVEDTFTNDIGIQPEEAQKWVATARALAPLVESELQQSTEDAIITPKVIQAWKEAGLYGVLLPKHLGGAGVDDVTYLLIAEEISRQDASAGWVYANHQTGTLFPGMLLSEEAFRELIGPQAQGVACGAGSPVGPFGTAKRVDGGYLVKTGPMPFGSGTQRATRIVARVGLVDEDDQLLLGEDGKPVIVFVWVDPKNVEWSHDWKPSGLHGTGSGSYRVKEHVLEAKWMGNNQAKGFPDDPAFAQGFDPVTIMHHVGVALGLVKRALEEMVKSAHGRRRGDIPSLDNYSLFQHDFVRLESQYQAARTFALDSYRKLWDAASGHGVTDLHITRIEQASLNLYRVLEEVISTASLWAGSDVISQDGVFARLNANARIAMNHILVGPQQLVHIAPPLIELWQAEAS